MAITQRQIQKRRAALDALPPTKFFVAINPHVFDPSTVVGDKTCLRCGQRSNYKLHITKHTFSRNPDSTLGKCICGLSFGHSIHGGSV